MAIPTSVLIKRYGGSRLYHTEAGRYVTLDDLAEEDFAVREAHSGEDITPSILKLNIRKRALHG